MARHRPGRGAAVARGEDGQASVEFAGVLPLVAVIALLSWQAVVTGQAVWLAGSAARAAARARAVGGDPADAARGVLPRSLRDGLLTMTGSDGEVSVHVRVPSVVDASRRIVTVSARARLRPQGG